MGIPGVSQIDALMRQWALDWARVTAPVVGFTSDEIDAYASAEAAAKAYAEMGTPSTRQPVNFERVLADVTALAQWLTPAPFGTSLRQLACNGVVPTRPRFQPGPYAATVQINDQLVHLLVELARHMRSCSLAMNCASRAARDYRGLLAGLRATFDVGVYNLNYDTAALAAWPDAHTGFDPSGEFVPANVHGRDEWGFIYHLHGSVHHSLDGIGGDKIVWRDDLSSSFDDGHAGRSTDRRSDGRSFPKTTLIAGGFKLDQLLVEPFHSLQAAFIRHAHEADAILIGGYGFGDAHVNRALQNRLDGRAGDVRPPVMVLDWAGEKTDPMEFRHDPWSFEMCRTLAANTSFFFEPGHASPPYPRDLAERAAFEVAAPHRVAIWHGGFDAAVSRLDGIVPWLEGEADSVLSPLP
jgi:hypothetical protein